MRCSATTPREEKDSMGIRINGIVTDATNLDLLARFWSELLGLKITRRKDDWVSLGPDLALQQVPEPKTVKNRVHLDLVADDFTDAVSRAAELGATPVAEMHEDLWQLWQDPEGNEFCLCVS
jgi:Glyoxalase-like domain